MAKVKVATSIADNAEIVRANINRRTEMSGDYVRLYANDVQVQITPWDVRLILGQIASTPTPNEPTLLVRQIADLSMSPQLAKKVAIILAGQLEHYERTVGPIPLPTD